jgi:hypothetical protein
MNEIFVPSSKVKNVRKSSSEVHSVSCYFENKNSNDSVGIAVGRPGLESREWAKFSCSQCEDRPWSTRSFRANWPITETDNEK